MDGAAGDLHHIRPGAGSSAAVAQNPRWQRRGRRRCADRCPVDDQHVTADANATINQIVNWKRPAPTSSASHARMKTPRRRSPKIARAAKVPLVADIHFHYRRAIEAAAAGAACLRINPGNIGNAQRVKDVIQAAKDHGCSIRIGVNAGSLEQPSAGKIRRAVP
jgi:(E)-4-hydroxy-3-methylbut-2-enyl-diphosphate synthase